MRAKFIKGLKTPEPIVLKTIISMDNKSQTKENFLALIDLVNRTNRNRVTRIDSVEIITSCYLQRHYVGESKGLELGEKWRSDNEPYLLQHLKISYRIIEWKKMIDNEAFAACQRKVEKLLQEDSAFQTIVNNLAKQHSHKTDKESASKYLFEECAVFLTMNGHVSYPSNSLNAAVTYVLEKFDSSLVFHGYMLYQEPEKKALKLIENKPSLSRDEKLTKNRLKISILMSEFGIHKPENQARFFRDFLELKTRHLELEGNIRENTSHDSADQESQKSLQAN